MIDNFHCDLKCTVYSKVLVLSLDWYKYVTILGQTFLEIDWSLQMFDSIFLMRSVLFQQNEECIIPTKWICRLMTKRYNQVM